MCARGVLLLCCVLSVSHSLAQGKVIRGVASSLEAWRQHGHCFHGKECNIYYETNPMEPLKWILHYTNEGKTQKYIIAFHVH